MGWKADIIFGKSSVGWVPKPEAARHRPEAVAALCAEAGITRVKTLGAGDLRYGVRPDNCGEIAVTVAEAPSGESFAAIGDAHQYGDIIGAHGAHPYVRAMLQRFPAGTVVVLQLQSVSGYWAFVVYERGRFLRAFSGDSDSPFFVNAGDPLPEEQVARIDGELSGEDCVSEVSKRIFGTTMWEAPLKDWPCTLLKRVRPWWRFW